MQATTLPPIKYLLSSNSYVDSKQILVEHYIKDTGVPVDYISAHSHSSRPSLSPTSSPLSTTPPITPMSQNVKQESLSPVSTSFHLPQPQNHLPSLASSASQQPSNGTNAAAHFTAMTTSLHTKPSMSLTAIATQNLPHRSNIFSLLSPPESPDMTSTAHHQNSPPTFDVYTAASGPVTRQEQPRYAAPHTHYNTYPAYTSIKPPVGYSHSHSATMNGAASRQPSSLVSSQTQGSTASPYHQYQQHQPPTHHHHPYAPQPINHQQQSRYSHPLQPTPISPYDRRTGATVHPLPRLDMANQMMTGNAGLKRIGSPKSLDDQSSSTSSSSSSTNRYQCPYCSKRFSRPSSLRIHTYSHTGEKPFVCTEPGCGRKFSVQSNMRRHLRVHRLGRPVKKVRYDGEVEGVKVMNPNSGLRTC